MRARVHSRVDDPSWYRVDSFVCYSLSNAGGIDKCQGRLRACRLGMGGLHSSVLSTSTGYGICMGYGVWGMGYGVWGMGYGARSMEHGAWNMAYDEVCDVVCDVACDVV